MGNLHTAELWVLWGAVVQHTTYKGNRIRASGPEHKECVSLVDYKLLYIMFPLRLVFLQWSPPKIL